ncbi:MAG: hypothetical protein P1P88_04940 [Bacteroidales bacterium]|nr:hypothetical protein [Bacteroidales bacterium]
MNSRPEHPIDISEEFNIPDFKEIIKKECEKAIPPDEKIEIKITAEFRKDKTLKIVMRLDENSNLSKIFTALEKPRNQLINKVAESFANSDGPGDFEDYDNFMNKTRIGDIIK